MSVRWNQLILPFTSRSRARSRSSWAHPEHSKSRVDKAGRALVAGNPSDEDLDVINNWRSSHSFPLNSFQMNLRRKAAAVSDRNLIAQRIKRLSSIEEKLSASKMRLSQMQDIGGCRAVVATVGQVRSLKASYVDDAGSKHQLLDATDYIERPRATGYRGVHLISRYHSDRSGKEAFNAHQIEIQLRSQLQHAWATAVETVDVFTNQALKKNLGDERWLRFFALMGSAIALRERSPLVEGTPSSEGELRKAIIRLTRELRVEDVLASYHVVMEMTQKTHATDRYYLLELRPSIGRVTVTPFTRQDAERATEKYLQVERAMAGESASQAVLVSVESLTALKRAYPNSSTRVASSTQ